jgi:hypothetical protein
MIPWPCGHGSRLRTSSSTSDCGVLKTKPLHQSAIGPEYRFPQRTVHLASGGDALTLPPQWHEWTASVAAVRMTRGVPHFCVAVSGELCIVALCGTSRIARLDFDARTVGVTAGNRW